MALRSGSAGDPRGQNASLLGGEQANRSEGRRALPIGTVTFLFTDIEGSTRLMRTLGDAYRQVQTDHFSLMRAAIHENDGIEVKTEGDAFFVVFASARQGVGCAADVQRRFVAHAWPTPIPLRVRMGIHTGEVALVEGEYLGIDVNLAARIAAAAHGGEIIVSAATKSLVADGLPPGLSLRALGDHRLKDFPRPLPLFQVIVDGIPQDFPPPRTLTAGGALPKPLTSFVGRSADVAAVRRLLRTNRLVTLTGPGGTGKTRLALQVASKPPASVGQPYFVDLSSVTDVALVPGAIANALGVGEVTDRSPFDALTDDLARRRALLVLDNLEQIRGVAPVIRRLIDAGDGAAILATSRARLRLAGEREFRVLPLEAPNLSTTADVKGLSRIDGVALFLERAQSANPGFRLTERNALVVANLVRRLDGLPLAIELAAGRMRLLSPDAILARLDSRLSLLAGDAVDVPERQRTIRAAIAGSYDMLDEPARRLLSRLAVFSGGWSLDGASRVCADDLGADLEGTMSSLVDGSLVRVEPLPNDEVRFSMLETIREYAAEQLAVAGEEAQTRRRHAAYVHKLCVAGEPHLIDQQQSLWLDRFDLEHDNIRAAIAWLEGTRQAADALQIGSAIWRFWQQRGHLAEGRTLLERLLAIPEGSDDLTTRARALIALGGIGWWQNDYPLATRAYDEAISIGRQLDDRSLLGRALVDSAFVPLVAANDMPTTVSRLTEALAAATWAGDRRLEIDATADMAFLHVFQGDPEAARLPLQQAIGMLRDVGNSWTAEEFTAGLGAIEQLVGETDRAERHFRESLAYFIGANNVTSAVSPLRGLAWVATAAGDHERAALLIGAEDRIRETVGGGPPALIDRLADLPGMIESALGPDRARELRLHGKEMDTGAALLFALRDDSEEEKTNA